MEKVFIQKIFKIVEEIISLQYEFEPTLAVLEKHLAKSKAMESKLYEAETLNALGILYAFRGDVTREIEYFKAAWEIAYRLEETDLIIKLTSNLSGVYLNGWELDEADKTLYPAVEIIAAQDLHLLGAIYIYSHYIDLQLLRGDFEAARRYFDAAWSICMNVDMQGYSRMEYFQIVMALHQQKAMIDIANGNGDAALSRLRLASSQIVSTDRSDLEIENQRIQIYHALICENDATKARQLEDAYVTEHGPLGASVALRFGLFLHHNGQAEWAQRYAQMVLDQETDENPLPLKLLEKARQLRSAT